MNELMTINYENENPTVSGRELHNALEVGTEYAKWFERMCEYGFVEGVDHSPILTNGEGFGKAATRTDHQLTIEMAKEIAMLQRTSKGKEVRRYFIELEKSWNTPELVFARALKLADTKIEQLKSDRIALVAKIEKQRPAVIFANAVSASHTSILVGELAKLLKQNGVDIGQNRLFQWLRDNGYLIRRKGSDFNMPTQYSMDLGLFEVKETVITHSDRSASISKTSKVTGKGQIYFINKLKPV